MLPYLLIFLGGGTGAVARYGVSTLMGTKFGTDFPWGTLTVNLIGAFLIGLFVEIAALRWQTTHHLLTLLLVTGFLGGFTTFSAFSLEAALMWQKGDFLNLAAYIGVSVIGTVALVRLAAVAVRVLA
jgi:CrcB protein